MGGAKLLEQIRDQFIGIPVLITSSSNKYWTFKELQNLGADAYWIKEGPDECRDDRERIENYRQLLELIKAFCHPRYKNLKIWWEKSQKITSSPPGLYWWTNYNWITRNYLINNEKSYADANARKMEVVGIIRDTLWLLRQDLKSTIVKYGFNPYPNQKWFLSSQAIQHLGKIMEFVHNITRRSWNTSFLINQLRQDKRGYELYKKGVMPLTCQVLVI